MSFFTKIHQKWEMNDSVSVWADRTNVMNREKWMCEWMTWLLCNFFFFCFFVFFFSLFFSLLSIRRRELFLFDCEIKYSHRIWFAVSDSIFYYRYNFVNQFLNEFEYVSLFDFDAYVDHAIVCQRQRRRKSCREKKWKMKNEIHGVYAFQRLFISIS